MTQFDESWSKATKAIFNGVLLYSLAGILYAIIEPISDAGDFLSRIIGDTSGLSTFCYILLAGIIIGYIMYLMGLSGFRKILQPDDSAAVGKIFSAVILVLVAEIFDFIPLLGWVGSILSLISFILMLVGYSALKNSQGLPKRACLGASKLFTSMILLLIGGILGFIPLVGRFIEMPFDVIAFILTLTGWAAIKNTVPSQDS
jgi:uncharacterized membrane protein